MISLFPLVPRYCFPHPCFSLHYHICFLFLTISPFLSFVFSRFHISNSTFIIASFVFVSLLHCPFLSRLSSHFFFTSLLTVFPSFVYLSSSLFLLPSLLPSTVCLPVSYYPFFLSSVYLRPRLPSSRPLLITFRLTTNICRPSLRHPVHDLVWLVCPY